MQLRALAVPLVKFPHVQADSPAAEVMSNGLPAIVDDSDGHAVGIFGLDELKIAARRDPVLARSNR